STIGKPNCSNQSFGTGGCTCVFCNVAGKPSAPIKCFSGTKSPDRPLDFHCAGCWSCSAARASSTASAGGEALFAGGAVWCAAKLFPNCTALHQMETAEIK